MSDMSVQSSSTVCEQIPGKCFKAYGICGFVPDEPDAEFAYRIGEHS